MRSFFISTTMDFLPFRIRSYAISQPVRLPPMITTHSPTSRPQRYSVASMACSSPEMGGFFFPCTVQGKKVPYLQQIGA